MKQKHGMAWMSTETLMICVCVALFNRQCNVHSILNDHTLLWWTASLCQSFIFINSFPWQH